MKVGDYVRTKSGIIGKIESKNYIGYSDWLIDTFYYNSDDFIDDWTCGVKEYNILKSNPNIMKLIEVGDYVNGKKVIKIWEEPFGEFAGQIFTILEGEKTAPTIRDIKSIVTKEQFESMEYKIEV